MEKLTYTNTRGESIAFDGPPFHLISVNGLGDVAANVQRQKSPFQDGSTRIGSTLQERVIAIEFLIVGDNYSEVSEGRILLSRIFNPGLDEGILRYENDHVIREIRAGAESVPFFPDGSGNRIESMQKGMVTLVASSPYWQDINPTNIKLEDYVSAFRFPFHFPVRFATRGDTRMLVNEGHAPTPVKITFRGESINPQITKVDTGETIRIKRTIPEGYSLVITTDFDNMSANIIAPDGVITDAMGYLDLSLNWSFFSLDVGENKLTFITEGGKPDVYIEYRNLYLGV